MEKVKYMLKIIYIIIIIIIRIIIIIIIIIICAYLELTLHRSQIC